MRFSKIHSNTVLWWAGACLMLTLPFWFNACGFEPLEPAGAIAIPSHFSKPVWPDDNIPTAAKISLGKRLFNDSILSLDSTIACASCHLAQKGMSDPRRFSIGVGDSVGLRQAMPVFNLAWASSFFWDGRSATLEDQALAPIKDIREMHNLPETVVARLKLDTGYVAAFQKAFGGEPTVLRMQQALASFERSVISANSPYDHYVQGDTNALTAQQKRGLALFISEQGECFHCHTVGNQLFTDFDFRNNGLYLNYPDPGRFAQTQNDRDRGKFKTPTLRNIAYTAPYMHDGSMTTLEQVVAHYASQGKAHPNRALEITAIHLNAQEQADIVAFMHALSDPDFGE